MQPGKHAAESAARVPPYEVWEHQIRDETDLRHHTDYIHFNPVKHGLVARTADWPHSRFTAYVEKGVYAPDWAAAPSLKVPGDT